MAQARRRPRPARGRQGNGPRVPWVALALLAVLGAAVLVARSLGRPPSAEPTPTSPLNGLTPVRTGPPPTRTLEPAAAPLATPAPTSPPKAATPVRMPRSTATSPVNAPTPVRAATPPLTFAAQPTVVAQPPPSPTPLQPVTGPTLVRNAPSVGEAVALTFDAGADRGYALDILDVLQQEHVIASFGVTGNWARANPDLVRRMAADGHLVFNHTLDHRSFTGASDKLGGLSAAARRAELDDADAVIAPLIGRSTRPYYRLPYGDDDARVASDVESAGYTHKIGWSVDSLGWRGIQSVDIVARCLKLAAPGVVYVLHVGRASQDALALPRIIHALRDRGYAFHRVDQT